MTLHDAATAQSPELTGDWAVRPAVPIVDGLLLATAHAHGLTFVTRNLADVEDRGVSVLAPY